MRTSPGLDPPAGPDIAIIAFTSGTSGRPKGVALTHDNLYWSMVNGLARLPVAADDVTLVCTPLAHVAILGGLPLYTWKRRGAVVLAPRFDPDLFIDLVRDHGVTTAFAVPAMLSLLARHTRFDTADLDSLRWVLAGGAPAVAATTTRLLDRGIRVVNSYGLTESSAGVTYADMGDIADRPTSAGSPVPHVELLIADENGAPADGPGEIWLRGPSVASSYWTFAWAPAGYRFGRLVPHRRPRTARRRRTARGRRQGQGHDHHRRGERRPRRGRERAGRPPQLS